MNHHFRTGRSRHGPARASEERVLREREPGRATALSGRIVAGRHTIGPMPGYTQDLAALCELLRETLHSLLPIYDAINLCPPDAGLLAGQQRSWDRHRRARLPGFRRPEQHALVAVISRSCQLRSAAERSSLGLVLRRFVTDPLAWGSSEYNFLELPDKPARVSASMSQKQNAPILERTRSKIGRRSAFSLDMLLGQRHTPCTTLVEVSKESGQSLASLFATTHTALRHFTIVMEQVRFRPAAGEREHMHGDTPANNLALFFAIPYRRAQGYERTMPEEILQQTFRIDTALEGLQSCGSTSPQAMADLLAAYEELHRWRAGEKGVAL